MQTIYQITKEFQSKYDKIIQKYLIGKGLNDEDIQELEKLRNNPFINTSTTDWRIMKLLLDLENEHPSISIYSESNIVTEYKEQKVVENKMYTLEKCDKPIHIEYPVFQYKNSEDVLYLIKTCPVAPEEYDVLNSHLEKIGHICIRHGKLCVDYIVLGSTKTIHSKLFNDKSKGSLRQSEWDVYIPLACELILNYIHYKK